MLMGVGEMSESDVDKIPEFMVFKDQLLYLTSGKLLEMDNFSLFHNIFLVSYDLNVMVQ